MGKRIMGEVETRTSAKDEGVTAGRDRHELAAHLRRTADGGELLSKLPWQTIQTALRQAADALDSNYPGGEEQRELDDAEIENDEASRESISPGNDT